MQNLEALVITNGYYTSVVSKAVLSMLEIDAAQSAIVGYFKKLSEESSENSAIISQRAWGYGWARNFYADMRALGNQKAFAKLKNLVPRANHILVPVNYTCYFWYKNLNNLYPKAKFIFYAEGLLSYIKPLYNLKLGSLVRKNLFYVNNYDPRLVELLKDHNIHPLVIDDHLMHQSFNQLKPAALEEINQGIISPEGTNSEAQGGAQNIEVPSFNVPSLNDSGAEHFLEEGVGRSVKRRGALPQRDPDQGMAQRLFNNGTDRVCLVQTGANPDAIACPREVTGSLPPILKASNLKNLEEAIDGFFGTQKPRALIVPQYYYKNNPAKHRRKLELYHQIIEVLVSLGYNVLIKDHPKNTTSSLGAYLKKINYQRAEVHDLNLLREYPIEIFLPHLKLELVFSVYSTTLMTASALFDIPAFTSQQMLAQRQDDLSLYAVASCDIIDNLFPKVEEFASQGLNARNFYAQAKPRGFTFSAPKSWLKTFVLNVIKKVIPLAKGVSNKSK